MYIKTLKSHPQSQNHMWGPVAVPPDFLLLFLSAAAWNPATSFSKPHSCRGNSATPKHSPFITWITIRKGLSQKEPSHTILLIIFSWELALVKTITHADYSPLFFFLKYIFGTINLVKMSLQKWLLLKIWTLSAKRIKWPSINKGCCKQTSKGKNYRNRFSETSNITYLVSIALNHSF